MDPLRFRSKVDWWLAALMALSAAASGMALAGIALAGSPVFTLAMTPVLLFGVVFPVWLLLATSYTFESSDLSVRSGPFSWRVPLHEIRTVTATHNPLSSPALSLDRLRIDFGRMNSIMISPNDKEGFLKELQNRVPAVQVARLQVSR